MKFRAPISTVVVAILFACSLIARSAGAGNLFHEAISAYNTGDYETAAQAFRQSAAASPASGTLLNLGLAEWQKGNVGAAIQAWEQSLWLNPYSSSARVNLRFARKAAQVEAPELSWNEVVSTWLPVNWWAWLAGLSLWLAVGMTTLPAVLRLPKAAWHQAVAAFGIMVFLLSVPAHVGVHTRSKLGFILDKEASLRLTPTAEAQSITRLGSGEPVRKLRVRGNFVLVRTSRATGWIGRKQFGLICPVDGKI